MNTTNSLATIGVDEMATILHKTPRTVSEDVYRRPESQPPRLRIPGSSKILWRVVDVERWLAEHVAEPVEKMPRRRKLSRGY